MHLLLVEDNIHLGLSLTRLLKQEGYRVTHMDRGDTAHVFLEDGSEDIDLIILDRMLPGMDGLTFCKKLRGAHIDTPILMLTAKGLVEDRVEGLRGGADDYLVKPFASEELLARIQALLRRPGEVTSSELCIGPDVCFLSREGRGLKKGKEVRLTSKEFQILDYLVHRPNMITSQMQIYEHCFDFAEIPKSNTVEVHIKNLRKKLSSPHYAFPLQTIKGRGYCLEF